MSLNAAGYGHAELGNFHKAVPLWRKASDSGYSKAHFNLGLCYELGKGVSKDFRVVSECESTVFTVLYTGYVICVCVAMG